MRIESGANIKVGVSTRDYVFRLPQRAMVQMSHKELMAAQLDAQRQAHASGLYNRSAQSAASKGDEKGKGATRFRYRSTQGINDFNG